jgi:hypothetical protein
MSPAFCRRCGSRLVSGVPEGDDRTRDYCAGCGFIEYRNPRVRAGCIVVNEGGTPVFGSTLLMPGERLQAGALRAVGAPLAEDGLLLYCAITDRSLSEVSLVFRAASRLSSAPRLAGDDPQPAWEQALLELFLADLAAGAVRVYSAEAEGGLLHMSPVAPG